MICICVNEIHKIPKSTTVTKSTNAYCPSWFCDSKDVCEVGYHINIENMRDECEMNRIEHPKSPGFSSAIQYRVDISHTP